LKRGVIFTALLLISSLAGFAADTKASNGSQTISGHLVDLACAAENSARPDSKFGATHDKSCLQMPDCEKSGYGVLTSDNKVIRFDSKGNEQAKKFIKMTDKEKDWKITVSGPVQGNTIAVNSLMLQK
jgi:hypothetical protein